MRRNLSYIRRVIGVRSEMVLLRQEGRSLFCRRKADDRSFSGGVPSAVLRRYGEAQAGNPIGCVPAGDGIGADL